MSAFVSDLRLVGEGLRSRIVHFVWMARRTTPGPALLRLIAASGALAALGVAVPSTLWASSRALFLVPVGAIVGLLPRSRVVTLIALLTVMAWLLSTIGYGEEATLTRTGGLAAGLYVMHAAAAMAAVVPYDAVVAPAALLRWALRVACVVSVSAGVALGMMTLIEHLQVVRTLVAPILGSVIAAGIVGLLAWHLRRR